MVLGMGSSSTLCVSVPAAGAGATLSSTSSSVSRLRPMVGGCAFCIDSTPQLLIRRNWASMQSLAGHNGSGGTPAWRRGLIYSRGVGRIRREELRLVVRASSSSEDEKGQKQVKTENVPEWAKPGSGELPPWARNERPASEEPSTQFSFAIYLVGSVLVAIAAIGSIFEYANRNPVFGLVYPDSPFYTPILGFFAITGLPSAGFLLFKSIQMANKASEEADKEDGYNR